MVKGRSCTGKPVGRGGLAGLPVQLPPFTIPENRSPCREIYTLRDQLNYPPIFYDVTVYNLSCYSVYFKIYDATVCNLRFMILKYTIYNL